LRVAGKLVVPQGQAPPPDAVEAMLLGALDPDARSEFEKNGEIDFCYTVEGLGRFRANLYREQRGIDGVFRHVPERARTLEQLGLPQSVAKLTNYGQGLVLVTGPTGCGKTSTLASLVNLINEERTEHVLTIEDPIEYLHVSKRCLVNQRSVKRHTKSFARALRAALREDPDVIVIGELRDLETLSLALTAAETGHLVMATMHTEDSLRTINRLVGAYPADQQDQVRMMLSESLRAVVSQRLLARADGNGRVAAVESLIVTKAVANLIRENKVFQISSILQTGQRQGMQTLERSIDALVAAGTVTQEEAQLHLPPSGKRAA
jgi:twitching motility protein PilT